MDLTKIKLFVSNGISWLKKNLTSKVSNTTLIIIGYLILIVICLSMCSRINSNNKDDTKYESNISALTDSIKQERLKNGNLQYSINGFIASEKELKELNKELYSKIKQQDGKIVSLNQSVIKLKLTEVELNKYIDHLKSQLGEVVPVNDSTFYTTWSLTYNYGGNDFDVISGKTTITHNGCQTFKHKDTHLTGIESNIDLTFGQKIEDGKLRVFITSPRQGFTAESLKGVFIDPNTNADIRKLMKKRHWFTGFGVGLGATTGYDILSQKQALTFGVTLNYNIYQW